MHPNNIYSAKSMMTTMKWINAKQKYRIFHNHAYMLLNAEAKRKNT